jgi:hypothetical protein
MKVELSKTNPQEIHVSELPCNRLAVITQQNPQHIGKVVMRNMDNQLISVYSLLNPTIDDLCCWSDIKDVAKSTPFYVRLLQSGEQVIITI